jgi:conjugative relaxase-like TrwC/TraI family protein
VLSIGKLVPGQASYYEQTVAKGRDDYYSGNGEAPGQWVGRAAGQLGLAGQVEAARFNAMVAGLDPRDTTLNNRLLSRERKPRIINGKRYAPVAAYDLTFSAPKSVSVLFALADPQTARELVASHDAAVHAAIGYLEDEAVWTRRGRNGAIVERGAGLVAAAYRHRMSRAKDPQLHTHVVAGNVVQTPSDGQWRTLHAAVIYRHARTAGVLYQAHLRAEVTDRLGLQWGPVIKGAAELHGIAHDVLREFSRRRVEIEQAAREDGIGLNTKAAAEAVALKTRTAKDEQVRTRDWRIDLIARAEEHGLDRQAIDALLVAGRARLAQHDLTDDQHPAADKGSTDPATTEPSRAAEQAAAGTLPPTAGATTDHDDEALEDAAALEARLVGPDGLTRNANTFDQRDALTTIAEHHQHGLRIPEIRDRYRALLAHPDVHATRAGDFTGIAEPRHTTTDLLQTEQRLIAAAIGRIATDTARIDPDDVDRFLTGRDQPLTDEQHHVVRRVATSGNGVDVIEALAGTGKTFTASAIHDLYHQTGRPVLGLAPTGRAARELTEVGIPARTIHSLLTAIDHQPDHSLLPDRAVLLLDEAGMTPTRLTDRLLHLAQQAGAKTVAIGDPGQLPSVQAGGWLRQIGRNTGALRLETVMRQRDPTERDALRHLHDQPTGGRAYLTWLAGRGRLHIDDQPARLLDQAVADWTTAVAEHGIEQAVLIARDHQTRDALNQRARGWRRQQGLLGEDHHYGERTLAVGDRVIARRNDSALDLDNGTRATITATRADHVELRTDAGATRIVPADYAREHLEHAYALTGHAMQGATVEWAAVVARQEQLTKGWAYTALSRARERTALYVPTENPQLREDRADIAPHDDQIPVDHEDLLQRVAGRMAIRDDEDLATTQLAVGGADALTVRAGVWRTVAPSNDTPRPPSLANAAAPPVRDFSDHDATRARLVRQRADARHRLDQLPGPVERRFRSPRDDRAAERSALVARIRAATVALVELDATSELTRRPAPGGVEQHGPGARPATHSLDEANEIESAALRSRSARPDSVDLVDDL